ncbi:MAG: hypothetical protein N2Z23_01550 [Pyrinomonadaceae bacterium]|nr:hypothetical protein [Pyrinomonadaceae bacterium]MCX7639115.1 hypothetical protein [Pyrinomonadaceae bacterium]MDW8303664.1 hypothetical protein [Acidobacteriota bacterium]
MKKIALISIFSLILACQTGNKETDGNTGKANVSVKEKDLPPEFSANPLPVQGQTPGIPEPSKITEVPKGPTPTPGIPDIKELNKPFKPGKTPTPGIPSPEEIKRQLNTPVDINVVNQPSNVNINKAKDKRKKSSDKETTGNQ